MENDQQEFQRQLVAIIASVIAFHAQSWFGEEFFTDRHREGC
jgi:hypothetical protein